MWAAIIGMIIALICTAVASITVSYYRRTVSDINENQAYLSARSIADLFANEIVNETEVGQEILNTLNSNGSCTVTDIDIGEAYGADKTNCSLNASINSSGISLVATVKIGMASKSVTVKLSNAQNSTTIISSSVFPTALPQSSYTWNTWAAPGSRLTALKINNNSDITEIGSLTSDDSFYYVGFGSDFTSQPSNKKSLQPLGTGSIFIYVNSGYSFYIDEISVSEDMKNIENSSGILYEEAPSVYIILAENADVYFNTNNYSSEINAYIYSPYENSLVNVGATSSGSYTLVNGSIMAKEYLLSGEKAESNKVNINYIAPFDGDLYVPGTSIGMSDWGVSGYEIT